METIKFAYSWNGKLSNKAFTTLRPHSSYYVKGKIYNIELKGEYKGQAFLADIRTTTAEKLNDFICLLDTGYNREDTLKMLQKMYPDMDIKTTLFDYCLLVYQSVPMPKPDIEHTK